MYVFLCVLSLDMSCSLIVSQCVVRATASGFCDAKDGHHSAQLLEISESFLTDAVRLQVCFLNYVILRGHLNCLLLLMLVLCSYFVLFI